MLVDPCDYSFFDLLFQSDTSVDLVLILFQSDCFFLLWLDLRAFRVLKI